METRIIRRSVKQGGKQKPGRAGATKNPAAAFKHVELRLHEVRCVKTTKEIDRDEIELAAIRLEAEAKAGDGKEHVVGKASGEHFDLGKFSTGDRKQFNPGRVLGRFPSGGASVKWPRHYVALLMMIEKDEGAIGTVVNAAVKSVEKELTAQISLAVATGAISILSQVASGAAIGSAIPIPMVGTALGAAAGAAVGLALNAIKKSRADDVFEPKQVQMRLGGFPKQAGEIPGSTKKLVLKGPQAKGGVYEVTYSWAVS